MKVIIDDKEFEADRVDVVYENEIIDIDDNGDDITGDIYLKHNSEGVITDIMKGDEVYKTYYRFLEDIC